MYGMKKMLFLFLAAALTVVIGSSGISADYSEVADLELVRTIAIDRDGEKLTLTACSGMGLEDETALISSIDADSLASAVNLLRRSGSRREPFFAHVEHLVIGEDALKNGNGVSPYLDYISRSLETRMDTNIFIVRGVSAKDFVLNSADDKSAAADMLSSLVSDVDMTTLGHVFTCGDVTARLASEGVALIQAVTLDENDDLGSYGEKMIVPAGFGIIKGDKLLGFTDEDATKGACILKGVAGFETVDIETDGGVTVTLGVKSVKARIKPAFSDGGIKEVGILLNIRANIEQADGTVSLTDEGLRKELGDKLSEIEKNRVSAAIEQAKELDADFLGIGQKIEFYHPVRFQLSGIDWDSAFKNTPVYVTADIWIDRSYDIINPAGVDGESS